MAEPDVVQIPNGPVFVLGARGSGLSWVASWLAEHPAILRVPTSILRGISEQRRWSVLHGGFRVQTPVTAEHATPEVRRALRQLWHSLDPTRKRWVVAADDGLVYMLPFLLAVFPEARFVWVRRSMPGVVHSLEKQISTLHQQNRSWFVWPAPVPGQARAWLTRQGPRPDGQVPASRVFPGGAWLHLCEYWLETNAVLGQGLPRLPPASWVDVRVAQLAASPEAELGRVFGFLGLPAAQVPVRKRATSGDRVHAWRREAGSAEVAAVGQVLNAQRSLVQAIDNIEHPTLARTGPRQASPVRELGPGFHPSADGTYWLGRLGVVEVAPLAVAARARLTLATDAAAPHATLPVRLSLSVGAQLLGEAVWTHAGQEQVVTVDLPQSSTPYALRLECDRAFVPAREGSSDDQRERALLLTSITVHAQEGAADV